jgi:hypothetical protein
MKFTGLIDPWPLVFTALYSAAIAFLTGLALGLAMNYRRRK